MIGDEYHDDLLTPGLVYQGSPPAIYSGMINVELDAHGRLTDFQAIPPQRLEPAKQEKEPMDWSPLFTAAGLDLTQFKPTEPLWIWLATSDARMAWTGTWPGTKRPLRVEAAALRGKPIAFSLISPWTEPWRMPPAEAPAQQRIEAAILSFICVLILAGAALLARRNVIQDRWDRRGSLHLAFWIFVVQMALWIFRSHFVVSIGTFAMFLLALCTSVFYGVLTWTLYVALEPFVRRHWPQTMIAWTTLVSGRIRDSIVGRDVLVGVALGTAMALTDRLGNRWLIDHAGATPTMFPSELLLGTRSMLGGWLLNVPQGTRNALFFFFMIFLMRIVVRSQWLAAAAFVLILTVLSALENPSHTLFAGGVALLILSIETIVVLRWGLLSLAVGLFVAAILVRAPATLHSSAWYFGSSIFSLASVVALAAWAFHTSIAGQRLWKRDLFG